MRALHRVAILATTLVVGGLALAADPMTLPPPTSTPAATATTPAKAAENLSDAQIASLLVVIDQGEIDAGKVVVPHATNADVKKFAQQMIDDHTAMLAGVVAWQKKTGSLEGTSQTQTDTTAGARQRLVDLGKLSGLAFDMKYVDTAVTGLQQVLDLLDHALITQADDAALATALRDVRIKVAGHLDTARRLKVTVPAHAAQMGASSGASASNGQ